MYSFSSADPLVDTIHIIEAVYDDYMIIHIFNSDSRKTYFEVGLFGRVFSCWHSHRGWGERRKRSAGEKATLSFCGERCSPWATPQARRGDDDEKSHPQNVNFHTDHTNPQDFCLSTDRCHPFPRPSEDLNPPQEPQ